MQTNLFTPEEPLYPLDYAVEVIENISTIKDIKYYSGTSPFGNYVALLNKSSLLELEFTDAEDVYIEDAQKRYSEAKFSPVKNWDIGKKLFSPDKYKTIATVSLMLSGTEFQLNVWNEILAIPFGQTATYDDIALKLGDKNASRAVGTAVGQNKIAYLVPCHRVVAKNGKISGFRWGPERKKQLLAWEYSY